MDEIIYIVTQGYYEEYHIEAIFKDKEKAETFCNCHEDCHIEEYEFADKKTLTPYNFVEMNFYIHKDGKDIIDFKFRTLAEEDCYFDWETSKTERITIPDINILRIILFRQLPNNYDKQKIINEYTEKYKSLRSEILNRFIEEIGWAKDVESIEEKTYYVMANLIKSKFGIKY